VCSRSAAELVPMQSTSRRAGCQLHRDRAVAASLALAEKRFTIFGLNGNFYNCDGEQLGEFFAPESFDLIYSFGVIHHTPNPRAIIEGRAKSFGLMENWPNHALCQTFLESDHDRSWTRSA